MSRREPPRLISVIVPVLDEERHLPAQLEALAAQRYPGEWEVLVVDNGCTDRSMEIARGWLGRLPRMRIVDARSERSLSHACNVGAAAARGDFLAFCDADDVVGPGWLAAMAAAALDGDLAGGPLEFETLNPPLLRAWRPDVAEHDLPVAHGFLPYAPGGNLGVWTEVAREVRWDEGLRFGSVDQDFSWRAQLASYRLVYAPDAVVHLRYRDRLSDLARQWYRYGRSGPLLFLRFRDRGMARSPSAEALGRWRWLVARAPRSVRSPARRGNWVRVAAFSAGRVVGSIRSREIFL